jgi:tyrosyl-tRNA synthetase
MSSVKRRLASSDGMQFAEFAYQLLQAYDFYRLYEDHNCTLQVGGADQWGNIIAGIDLIWRKKQETVFGIVTPLMTTAKGEKFGKSAGNAVWLDDDLTSTLDFYQVCSLYISCEKHDRRYTLVLSPQCRC